MRCTVVMWTRDLWASSRADQRRKAFRRARAGVVSFGPVYFVRNSEPYMRIAVPIEWFVGAVEGVLLAEVNLRYIRDVVADIRVGESGYAYVVSQEGDLIAHPDLSLVLQKRNLDELDQVRAALAGALADGLNGVCFSAGLTLGATPDVRFESDAARRLQASNWRGWPWCAA